MGMTLCTPFELQLAIDELALKYTCGFYNIFSNNCNHFSDEFLKKITGTGLPPEMFRMTNLLKCACWCLPKGLVSGQWELDRIRRRELEEVAQGV